MHVARGRHDGHRKHRCGHRVADASWFSHVLERTQGRGRNQKVGLPRPPIQLRQSGQEVCQCRRRRGLPRISSYVYGEQVGRLRYRGRAGLRGRAQGEHNSNQSSSPSLPRIHGRDLGDLLTEALKVDGLRMMFIIQDYEDETLIYHCQSTFQKGERLALRLLQQIAVFIHARESTRPRRAPLESTPAAKPLAFGRRRASGAHAIAASNVTMRILASYSTAAPPTAEPIQVAGTLE